MNAAFGSNCRRSSLVEISSKEVPRMKSDQMMLVCLKVTAIADPYPIRVSLSTYCITSLTGINGIGKNECLPEQRVDSIVAWLPATREVQRLYFHHLCSTES